MIERSNGNQGGQSQGDQEASQEAVERRLKCQSRYRLGATAGNGAEHIAIAEQRAQMRAEEMTRLERARLMTVAIGTV